MAQLGLELFAGDFVKMEDRQEVAEPAAEDKRRITAAHKVETAAGFAASL
jgi:hypothetical protein